MRPLQRRHLQSLLRTPIRRVNADGRRLEETPYLAPELLSGGEAGHAADVYAFGTLMYEVLKQELVVADVAVRADLNAQSDADALAEFAQSVVEGERCASAVLVAIAHARAAARL